MALRKKVIPKFPTCDDGLNREDNDKDGDGQHGLHCGPVATVDHVVTLRLENPESDTIGH